MEQITFPITDSPANLIKSKYKTLEAYLATSMALHNGPVQSVFSLAAGLGDQVLAIAEKYPEDAQVQRWSHKFEAFIIQHGLDEPRVGD